jgi:chromatin assembly factor 1 subunit A
MKISEGAAKKNIYRRKCIIIEDSYRSKYDGGKGLSNILTCRNPFKCDNDLINYDMDSEDEWAEQNGEDLNENNLKSEDDEDDLAEEEEQKGFIVDDDYLSVSEMNYSNISSKDQNEIMADLARKKAIIQKNRESKEVLAKNNEL